MTTMSALSLSVWVCFIIVTVVLLVWWRLRRAELYSLTGGGWTCARCVAQKHSISSRIPSTGFASFPSRWRSQFLEAQLRRKRQWLAHRASTGFGDTEMPTIITRVWNACLSFISKSHRQVSLSNMNNNNNCLSCGALYTSAAAQCALDAEDAYLQHRIEVLRSAEVAHRHV